MRRPPLLVLLALLLSFVARSEAQTTALYMDSQPGDTWVGQERTWNFDTTNATFSARTVASTRTMLEFAVAPIGSPSYEGWTLEFSNRWDAPALLPAGTYSPATRAVFTEFEGIDVSGHGAGCNRIYGRFVVLEAEYGPNNTVVRFAADFEQHCEDRDGALFGALRYNSTISSLTPFGGAYPSYKLLVTRPLHGTISGAGLECGSGGSTCTSTFAGPTDATLFATPDPGYMLGGWSGACHGGPTAAVRVHAEKPCSAEFQPATGVRRNTVMLTGSPGDFTVHNKTETLTSSNSRWQNNPFGWGVRVQVDGIGDASDLYAVFSFQTGNATGVSLGTYSIPRFPDVFVPGMSIIVNSTACSSPGTFTVLDYGPGPSGTIGTLAVDFTGCGVNQGQLASLAGSLRFNSTLPPSIPVMVAVVGGGRVTGSLNMNCTNTCAGFAATGASVTFSAQPEPGYRFAGWSGDPACASGSFTATAGMRCTATFVACPMTLSTSQFLFGNSGGSTQVTVTTDAGCSWNATPSSAWLTVDTPGQHTGSGTVTLTATSKRSAGTRREVFDLGIPGVSLTMSQQGGSGLPMHASMWGSGGSGSDIGIWRPEGGGWFFKTAISNYTNYVYKPFGSAGDTPVTGDFDGDGLADLAVWRGSTGSWFIRSSGSGYADTQAYQWGAGALGDIPVAADFDGDGRTDLAVWRASSSYWYVKTSSSNYASYFAVQWGAGALGDVPIVADFDGDEKADIVVWRRSDGYWYIRLSHDNYATIRYVQWGIGALGDVPVAGDYDGDGRSDIAVWRGSTGYWYVKSAASNFATYQAVPWGAPGSGDTPLIGDYDGDGKTDLTLWRPSDGVWRIKTSSTNWLSSKSIQWGASALGDVPLPRLAPR